MASLLNEMFDCVFCINLEHRPERWNCALARFEEAGVSVERFRAVAAASSSRGRWADAVKACAASHIAVVREARRRGARSVFIFQDDIVLHPRFDETLRRRIAGLPETWEMLYLGGWHPRTAMDPNRGEVEVPGPTHVEGNIYRLRHDFCLHACGVRDRLFDEILHIDPQAGEPIDCTFVRLFQRRGNCYGLMTDEEARPGAWGLAQQDHSLGSDLRDADQLQRFEWPGWPSTAPA